MPKIHAAGRTYNRELQWLIQLARALEVDTARPIAWRRERIAETQRLISEISSAPKPNFNHAEEK